MCGRCATGFSTLYVSGASERAAESKLFPGRLLSFLVGSVRLRGPDINAPPFMTLHALELDL